MPKPIRLPVSLVVVALLVAAASLTAIAGAAAATAPTWKIGDCFSDAQVDFDSVTLASAVPCTKEHEVQVVGGADLPAALASQPLSALVDLHSAVRPQVVAFAAETCSPSNDVKSIYPKQAAALSALFEKHDIEEFVVPAAGQMGWALTDAASFDAGTKAMLCVFHPNPSANSGSTAGDIRKISTRDPLATLRLCSDFNDTGSEYQRCDKVHDIESLIWVKLPLSGQPADPNTWQDADWAPFDAVCAEFGAAVVGARRADFKFNSDTDPAGSVFDGSRMFNCRAYPKSDTAAIPANVILAGAGKAKIKLAKT